MVIVLGIRFHFYRILHSITYIHSRDSCTIYLLLRQCNSFEIIVSLWCAINLLKMEILQQILCETNSPFFLCIYISLNSEWDVPTLVLKSKNLVNKCINSRDNWTSNSKRLIGALNISFIYIFRLCFPLKNLFFRKKSS